MRTTAFLTGSHVYGVPHAESDVDLVVLVEPGVDVRLRDLLGLHGADDLQPNDSDYDGHQALRIGKLNLILCRSEERFETWRRGTDALVARWPVTREQAIEEMRRRRAEEAERRKAESF